MAERKIVKVQMNSLVPESIDEYVELLHEEIRIGKSELVYLFVAYFKMNFTKDEITDLARQMFFFGEQGLMKGPNDIRT